MQYGKIFGVKKLKLDIYVSMDKSLVGISPCVRVVELRLMVIATW
jgi:hypothetical protein